MKASTASYGFIKSGIAFANDSLTTPVKKASSMLLTLSVLTVAGCQAVPVNDVANVNRYNDSNGEGSSFKSTNPEKIAEVRTRMAAQYIRDNDLDAAQRQLERALSANKRYAPAYDMMGVLLQKEGSRTNLAKADGFFKQAIEIDPEFMQARNNYGVYLSQMGRNTEAIKQFETAGAALGYEGRIKSLENLGRTALKIEDTALASQAFIRVLESDRNNLIAHIEMVDILIDSNRYLQAQNLYEETRRILGNDADKVPRILLQGIKLAHAQNHSSLQEKLSRQLLADFPLSEEARTLKGWIRNPEAPWK